MAAPDIMTLPQALRHHAALMTEVDPAVLRILADAIRLMTDAAGRLEPIDAIERQPTHIHSVLIFVVEDGTGTMDADPYWEVGIWNEQAKRWQMNFGDADIEVQVSHWLPLPGKPR